MNPPIGDRLLIGVVPGPSWPGDAQMGSRRASIPPIVPIRLAALRTAEELASGSNVDKKEEVQWCV